MLRQIVLKDERDLQIIMDNSFIKSVFQKLASKVDKLEKTTEDVQDELNAKRQARDEWFKWHFDWKNAWVTESKEMTEEEKEKKKVETSVTSRYKALDI